MNLNFPTSMFVCAVVVAIFPLAAQSQPQNPARADIRGPNGKSVMVAVYNLVDDPADCVVRHYSGTIIKVHHEKEYGTQINGFTLLGLHGERNYFNVDPDIYDDFRLARAEIGWLPTLIATNKRVRVDGYVCGPSGGVSLAHNIISQTLPAAATKTRHR